MVESQQQRRVPYGLGPDPPKTLEIKKNIKAWTNDAYLVLDRVWNLCDLKGVG